MEIRKEEKTMEGYNGGKKKKKRRMDKTGKEGERM